MAKDGEGASRLLTVKVAGARDDETARILAHSIAGSSLVKAACFGADANWGRALCAMGYSGADFEPAKVSMTYASRAGDIDVFRMGQPLAFSEETAKKILVEDEVEIRVTCGEGGGSAESWGCDLTYDYVKINGDYRS
jgi:glutamate N-acetyltransferase/amino-acid N-acetyltransferase